MTKVPLSDQEEAVLQLLLENNRLKAENENLKQRLRELSHDIEHSPYYYDTERNK
jgi:regulator of replication initiation timing